MRHRVSFCNKRRPDAESRVQDHPGIRGAGQLSTDSGQLEEITITAQKPDREAAGSQCQVSAQVVSAKRSGKRHCKCRRPVRSE